MSPRFGYTTDDNLPHLPVLLGGQSGDPLKELWTCLFSLHFLFVVLPSPLFVLPSFPFVFLSYLWVRLIFGFVSHGLGDGTLEGGGGCCH